MRVLCGAFVIRLGNGTLRCVHMPQAEDFSKEEFAQLLGKEGSLGTHI